MKKLGSYLGIAAIVIVVLLLAKNVVAQSVVQGGVKAVTGLNLKIKKLDVALFNTYVAVEDLKLHNPKGFKDEVMVDLPEIYVDYHLRDILGGNIHLSEMRIDLNEFVVIKNEDGKLNLDSLTALQQKKEKKEKAPKEKKGSAPQIQLDQFSLRIGKVIYKDYSSGKLNTKEFNVGINEQFSDITDPNDIVRVIVVKIMMKTPLAALTNFDISGLQGAVGDTLASSKELAVEAFGKAAGQVDRAAKDAKALASKTAKDLKNVASKETLEDAAKTAKNLTGGLKNAAGSLGDKIKMPFGSKE